MTRTLSAALVLLVASVLASCTIVEVRPDTERAQRGSVLKADGFVRGHIGVVPPSEDRIINVSVLDGQSPGSLAEVIVWKIFRFELGAAGLSLGLGPLTMGIGTLFYDPIVPASGWSDDDDDDYDDHDHDHDHSHAEEMMDTDPESAESMPESESGQ